MDLCVIPPIPHLKQFKQKRHLVLSHLLPNREYRTFYEERRQKGDYIILDNSAHENGMGEGPGRLLLQALDLEAQELVVPDKLENSEMTLALARNALISWYGSDGRLRGKDIRLMYVPQGKNPDDWHRCLIWLCNLHASAVSHWNAPKDFTIGISKDYAVWEGGLLGLLQRAEAIITRDDVEVHLLGSGHDYWAAADIGEVYDIRSVDTAKPFVWAMNGMRMNLVGTRPEVVLPEELPKRPEKYFYTEFGDLNLAKHNVSVMRKMVEDGIRG